LNLQKKTVWVTDGPINQTIQGHGKLVVIYNGRGSHGSIGRIDGWKGKIILCGFVVEEMKRLRGKVILVNSSVKKIEYSHGRVVANLVDRKDGKFRVSSRSISGGLLNPGVFAINNDQIQHLGDWTRFTNEASMAKSQVLSLQRSTLAEQELSIKELTSQIAELERESKTKHHKHVTTLRTRIHEVRNLMGSLLKLRIRFESKDDDHDCDRESNHRYTIDIFKRWRDYAEKAKGRIKECRSEGHKLLQQVRNDRKSQRVISKEPWKDVLPFDATPSRDKRTQPSHSHQCRK
jgi:uncharacterized coiled-coil protein SlyX